MGPEGVMAEQVTSLLQQLNIVDLEPTAAAPPAAAPPPPPDRRLPPPPAAVPEPEAAAEPVVSLSK